jgi:hypothetical protein
LNGYNGWFDFKRVLFVIAFELDSFNSSEICG